MQNFQDKKCFPDSHSALSPLNILLAWLAFSFILRCYVFANIFLLLLQVISPSPACCATLKRLGQNTKYVTQVQDLTLASQNTATVSKLCLQRKTISDQVFIFSEKEVIFRGCSSKRKMFHIECESHLSGTRNEQFCYCSYDLCNGAANAGGERKLSVTVIYFILLTRFVVYL